MNFLQSFKAVIKNNIGTLTIIVLFVIIYGSSVYFLNRKLTETQKQIERLTNNQEQVLDDEIVRSLSQRVDNLSALENELEVYFSNLDDLSKDLDKLNAKLNSFNVIEIRTPGANYQGLPSSKVSNPDIAPEVKCLENGKCEDSFGFLTKKQHFSLFEPFNKNINVPFGEVSFESWKSNPWSYQVLPREYRAVTVIGEQGQDMPPVVYNQFKIIVDNKEYEVPISQVKTVTLEKQKGFRVKPNIFLGISSGVSLNNEPNSEVYPYIEASIFEYGKENYNPSWAFVGISTGYNVVEKSFAVGISPFQYNIADHLPLINNLYIGPQVSFSTEETISVLGSLKVRL